MNEISENTQRSVRKCISYVVETLGNWLHTQHNLNYSSTVGDHILNIAVMEIHYLFQSKMIRYRFVHCSRVRSSGRRTVCCWWLGGELPPRFV